MEDLNKVVIKSDQLGTDYSLSSEYWLSTQEAEKFSGGIPLGDVVALRRQGVSLQSDSCLILDTGNADRGLLNLKVIGGADKQRISHKKIVPEGAVIISRLRPYLRQVAYIPHGFYKELGIDQLLCSTEFYVLVPKEVGENIAFLVPWLLSPNVQGIFERATTGGHHPRFDEELLYRLTIPEHWYNLRGSTNKSLAVAIKRHIESQLEMNMTVQSVDAA